MCVTKKANPATCSAQAAWAGHDADTFLPPRPPRVQGRRQRLLLVPLRRIRPHLRAHAARILPERLRRGGPRHLHPRRARQIWAAPHCRRLLRELPAQRARPARSHPLSALHAAPRLSRLLQLQGPVFRDGLRRRHVRPEGGGGRPAPRAAPALQVPPRRLRAPSPPTSELPRSCTLMPARTVRSAPRMTGPPPRARSTQLRRAGGPAGGGRAHPRASEPHPPPERHPPPGVRLRAPALALRPRVLRRAPHAFLSSTASAVACSVCSHRASPANPHAPRTRRVGLPPGAPRRRQRHVHRGHALREPPPARLAGSDARPVRGEPVLPPGEELRVDVERRRPERAPRAALLLTLPVRRARRRRRTAAEGVRQSLRHETARCPRAAKRGEAAGVHPAVLRAVLGRVRGGEPHRRRRRGQRARAPPALPGFSVLPRLRGGAGLTSAASLLTQGVRAHGEDEEHDLARALRRALPARRLCGRVVPPSNARRRSHSERPYAPLPLPSPTQPPSPKPPKPTSTRQASRISHSWTRRARARASRATGAS